jgi:hypothetical protein
MISNGFADSMNDFVDTIWEAMMVLVAAAAVCICVTDLASRVESGQTADPAFVEVEQDGNLFPPLFTNGYEALRF